MLKKFIKDIEHLNDRVDTLSKDMAELKLMFRSVLMELDSINSKLDSNKELKEDISSIKSAVGTVYNEIQKAKIIYGLQDAVDSTKNYKWDLNANMFTSTIKRR